MKLSLVKTQLSEVIAILGLAGWGSFVSLCYGSGFKPKVFEIHVWLVSSYEFEKDWQVIISTDQCLTKLGSELYLQTLWQNVAKNHLEAQPSRERSLCTALSPHTVWQGRMPSLTQQERTHYLTKPFDCGAGSSRSFPLRVQQLSNVDPNHSHWASRASES